MAPRKSGIPHLLLTAVVTAVGLLIYYHFYPPRSSHRPSRRHASEYGRSPYEYGQRPERGHATFHCDSGAGCTSEYLDHWQIPAPHSCRVRISDGLPVPDPRCTPGGFNPEVTVAMLRAHDWSTRCIRNCQTSEAQKHVTYSWYGIRKPRENSGENQVCELDHLVPLELGGADGLGNIWPECGPQGVSLNQRDFKLKDRVENYLADQVRTGQMPLREAQRGIANDWTQYLGEANQYCAGGGRC